MCKAVESSISRLFITQFECSDIPVPQQNDDGEVQIAAVCSQLPGTIEATLEQETMAIQRSGNGISQEQLKYQTLRPIILYLKDGTLPEDVKLAKKVMVQSTVYTICNDVLYYVGSKQMETGRVVVPQHLHQKIMHDGQLAGHFLGPRFYKSLVKYW